MTNRCPVNIQVSAGACIWVCLLILIAPLNFLCSFYFAAFLHELSHILMLRLFRVPIHRITIGVSGAVIESSHIPPVHELACTAAGPVGSFLCLLFWRKYPLIALSGLLQGIYNLLPIYPMDGGRMLRCFCLLYCPNRSDFICKSAKRITITLIVILCIYLYSHTKDSLYLLITLYFLLQTCAKRKIPCKQM